MADLTKKLLHEPLVHFLLLGAAMFAAYSLLARAGDASPGRIVVTQGQIASMEEGFMRARQRAPTGEEMEGLIRDRVQEEAYVREALALGLDKNDLIIRRRLRQKMEFVSEGQAAPVEPSDEQLQAYLNAHPATFATEPRFSFRQVYLDPQRHGANLARDAERLLASLGKAGAKTSLTSLGDPFPLEHECDNASAREVENLFGEKFPAELGKLVPGRWQGPVASGYGVHLVFLAERTEGGQPAFADVRDAVRREWADAQQREAAERFTQTLLRKYTVTIETSSAAANVPDSVAAR